MRPRLFVALCLVSTAATFHSASASPTQAGPSPNAMFQFQKDNQRHPWLHITADSGMVERKARAIDPLGLHGLSAPDGARSEESISWDRVQRLDEVVTRAGTWQKVGQVTLGLLGAGLGNAINPENGGLSSLAGLAVFGTVGGYLGSRYGERFRSERNWYVADTTRHEAPQQPAEIAAPVAPLVAAPVTPAVASAGANPDIIAVCNRIGPHQQFRALGSFGSFTGYAGIAGPDGLEQLRADRHGRDTGTPAPTRITWDQIYQVEMRGGSALRGAAAGAATFGALGALLGMAAVSLVGESDINAAEGALIGALYVAPVGIVLGGLSGTAVRRWVTVYHRR